MPQRIGGHTRIGNNCMVESASIGDGVFIGNNCKLMNRSIIKDVCYIYDGTVLSPDTVVPPFCRVRGDPGRLLDQPLPESAVVMLPEECEEEYADFVRGYEEDRRR